MDVNACGQYVVMGIANEVRAVSWHCQELMEGLTSNAEES
jgi:hypothetical protein